MLYPKIKSIIFTNCLFLKSFSGLFSPMSVQLFCCFFLCNTTCFVSSLTDSVHLFLGLCMESIQPTAPLCCPHANTCSFPHLPFHPSVVLHNPHLSVSTSCPPNLSFLLSRRRDGTCSIIVCVCLTQANRSGLYEEPRSCPHLL